jgi:hypothetical protein
MVGGTAVQEHQGPHHLSTHLPRRVQPKVQTNLSQLELIAKHLKEEMHAAKAARRSGLDAECVCQEARGRKNVRQEGAVCTLTQGYGIEAPGVADANKARQLQNQDACNLLACNPRSQNLPLQPHHGGRQSTLSL